MSLVRRLSRDRGALKATAPAEHPAEVAPRVVIASPMMDMCHTVYATSLVRMALHTLINLPGMPVQFLNFGTSILPLSRQLLACQAIELGATHILWVDSDMTFPQDALIRLLAHRKAIVAANCVSRRPPFMLTARRDDAEVYTNPESTGLERVDRVGTGFMMVNMDVYKALTPPWFALEWLPDKGIFAGEDFWFCNRATEAGFEIYIDHDISKQVEHIGQFGLNPLVKARLVAMTAAAQGTPT